jgi:hypothetical protein
VKSGLQSDVSIANIRRFFMMAPPKDLIDTADRRFRFMNTENKRWHTDKLMQQFGEDFVVGELKESFDTISKLVVQLRQEAKRDRRD